MAKKNEVNLAATPEFLFHSDFKKEVIEKRSVRTC